MRYVAQAVDRYGVSLATYEFECRSDEEAPGEGGQIPCGPSHHRPLGRWAASLATDVWRNRAQHRLRSEGMIPAG